jgi:predicted metal-dependent peptidase
MRTEEDIARSALKIVELAKNDVVARAPYLAPAVGLLEPEPSDDIEHFAVAGTALYYNPLVVIDRFRTLRAAPTAELLHVLAHCLMLHPSVDSSINKDDWNLACDIVTTRLATELLPPFDTNGAERARALADVEAVCGAHATAERIFAALRDGEFLGCDVVRWEKLFAMDDHKTWYDEERYGFAKNRRIAVKRDPKKTGKSGLGEREEIEAGERAGEGDAAGADARHETRSKRQAATRGDRRRREAKDLWEKTSYDVRLDLESFSAGAGEKASGVVLELAQATRRRVDYAGFLRTFGTPEEAMRASDEEFDYVYYCYGLARYGDVALVEPLEYRPERRVRQFVIALDTSGSIEGGTLQRFVDATCSLLEETDLFSRRLDLLVVQCDEKVQKAERIRSRSDLDAWLARPKYLYGFRETDFRPVFEYVDALRAQGELKELCGLLYFTDGKGVYPERRPDYRCAFAYWDPEGRGHAAEKAPPWALAVELDAGDIDRDGKDA